MDVGTGGTRLFDVRGDGLTTVSSGGMDVLAGGVSITGGLTVRAGVPRWPLALPSCSAAEQSHPPPPSPIPLSGPLCLHVSRKGGL
jgi:hypothetical protein